MGLYDYREFIANEAACIELWTNCYIHANLQKISDIITKNINSRVTP